MSHNLEFLDKFLVLKHIVKDRDTIRIGVENNFYKEAYEKISKLSTKENGFVTINTLMDKISKVKTMKEVENLIKETCFERNEDVPYEKIYQIYLASKNVYYKTQIYFGFNSTIEKLSNIFPDYDFDEESKNISQEEVKKVLMNYFYNNGDDKRIPIKIKEIATEKNFNDFDQGILSAIEKKIKEFNIQGQNLQRDIQYSLNDFQKDHEEFVERYVKGNSPSHFGDGRIHNTDRQEKYLKDKDIPEDKKREQIIFNINGEYSALQSYYLFNIQLLSIYINSESFFIKILQDQFKIISTLKQKIKEASKGETSKNIPPKAEEFLNKLEELKDSGRKLWNKDYFNLLITRTLKETYKLYSHESEYQEKLRLILSRYAEIFNLTEDYNTSLDDVINRLAMPDDKQNKRNLPEANVIRLLLTQTNLNNQLCSKAIL